MDRLGHESRGFVFSVDALLSVMIVALFVLTLSFFSSHSAVDYSTLDLERKANDALSLLQKQGYLASQNATLIESRINSTSAPNVGWNIDIEYYEKLGEGSNISFSLKKRLTFGQNDSTIASEVVANRIFVVANDSGNVTGLYGRVRLKEWIK